MWKRKIFLACLVVLLAGCGRNPEDHPQGREGIYYRTINEKTIEQAYNPMAQYTGSTLLYKGRIYTSYMRNTDTEKENLRLDELFENELAAVKGNHGVFWSVEGEELSEVTCDGTLYQVKGYDDEFRVGIYYETPMPLSDTIYNLVIFEQLNDITLHKGEELFEHRFHLEEAVCIEGRSKKEGTGYELPVDSAEVQEFLAALNEGIFTDPEGAEYLALDPEKSCVLSFYDSNDLVTDIRIYEAGYVVMERGTESVFIVKAEPSVCKNIVELLYEK